ncbi:diaminohydroxyphosphoribosylaminopyrimidine deaminase/5-amino-6-(5-phosphoribosylamino)uracil reductase [Virgibacillus natechei]|uniref:Riboflavin biosynthesis protein RibD n=1 Tax=Virgibacillus natechei TaxID=1216297 RepID=A0ABS4II99_9BACI|nr:bifunctional diaminohydroxyphosphoribosylaminopyrimidine deaminase/5-amino-6-(5-phosphoribosylamino)uracil reductase RibD [Virgibacillus natechei]MBP1970651.1 diaminohydroxyphosphoribosylaminopyrimidine deaminase/5-amino-6-(5-phosphoribosylamino)uracil reductase [Virgibacillus natechei]UZD13963.1 bifunctional diaminohydroxyphosphoribosylaminopyrimidine deaminase/5-amino-6-(5-phosphoribosylamino)uracil reductase RibD [Virgibacillus natechei]
MKDEDYMKIALELAHATSAQTSPNPPVGSVVVKDGVIVGMGAHLEAGEAHAEVHALQMAGDKAIGATIYVTLEPCAHHGRTPPCAELIIDKGIKRAVIAVTDPNEKVAGQGINMLREANVQVDLGVLEKDAEELNAVFFHYTKTKTPFVTVKSAISLDGKTATVTGESKWITGEEARLDVHHYRRTHDAILVGINTVLTDNPSLTARIPNSGGNPVRIILDTNLRTPLDANVVTDNEAPTWIFVGKHVEETKMEPFFKKPQVDVIQLEDEEIRINNVLEMLGEREITSLFVEGGAAINGSFLKNGQINQLLMYMAPKLIGGKLAPTSFTGEGIRQISDVLELEIKEVEMIGEDIKFRAETRKEEKDVYRNN